MASRTPSTSRSSRDRVAERRLSELLTRHGYVLLYDGRCGLCNGTVQFVLRRDRIGAMRFATLEGPLGEAATRLLPGIRGVDSVVLLHRDGAWVRSTAVLELARYLGGGWSLLLAGYLLPRPVRDWLYNAIARRRYRWFGRYAECPLPAPEVRDRFVD